MGQQPGRAGAVERGDAVRAAAVQVDGDVDAPAERRDVTGPRHVAHLVHPADQRHQGRQHGGRGQHDPMAGMGAAQGAQGGDRGEQVTETQPAQHHHDRPVRRRLGGGGDTPPSLAGVAEGLGESHVSRYLEGAHDRLLHGGRSGSQVTASFMDVRRSTASTTHVPGTDDRHG